MRRQDGLEVTSAVVRAPVSHPLVVEDQRNWNCTRQRSGLWEQLATVGLVRHSAGLAATRASRPTADCLPLVAKTLLAARPDIDWIASPGTPEEYQVQDYWRNQAESAAETYLFYEPPGSVS